MTVRRLRGLIAAHRRALIRARRLAGRLTRQLSAERHQLARLTAPRPLAGRGPDVSGYQGRVDWAAVKAGGARYGICKATEGTAWIDPTFARNWRAIRAAGLPRAAYHFCHPGRDAPELEARHFARTVKAAGYSHDDRLILDCEVTHGGDLDLWVDRFYAQLHRELPLIEEWLYTYTSFHSWRPRPHRKLWLANYGPRPALPGGFIAGQLALWQYTSAGRWAGIAGNVDLSRNP